MGWKKLTERLQDAASRAFSESAGGRVRYKPEGSSAEQQLLVHAIFRSAHVELNVSGSEAAVSARGPVLHVRLAYLGLSHPITDAEELVLQAARFEIPDGGGEYRVVDIQPDGEGMVELELQEIPE